MKKPQGIKRIGIFPGHSATSKNLAKNLSECLTIEGFEIVGIEDNPDIVVVSGGDVAMLHAIRVFGKLKIPFLCVNAGHVGFLMNSDVDMDSMKKSIERTTRGASRKKGE